MIDYERVFVIAMAAGEREKVGREVGVGRFLLVVKFCRKRIREWKIALVELICCWNLVSDNLAYVLFEIGA